MLERFFWERSGSRVPSKKAAFTKNIRWSARLDFPNLVDGETDYIDLFKDGEEANKDPIVFGSTQHSVHVEVSFMLLAFIDILSTPRQNLVPHPVFAGA